MATRKHMGRGELVDRLSAQVGSKPLAENILRKRGQLDHKGKLTKEGKERDAMTAAERAKDRAAKGSGRKPSDFSYSARTNTAKVKRG